MTPEQIKAVLALRRSHFAPAILSLIDAKLAETIDKYESQPANETTRQDVLACKSIKSALFEVQL
jgi:hypothetical protein